MSKLFIPKDYAPKLNVYDTQKALELTRQCFQEKLCSKLNLVRATAPLFVEISTGLNDDLSGVERAVSFDIKETKITAQVVHSLAKWKRLALYRYKFHAGEGIYTDMNAIRRDEEMDNIHSIYVDQWDWEKIILEDARNEKTLRDTVQDIVDAIYETSLCVETHYPNAIATICRNVTFVTTQELEDLYPDMTAKERENAYVEKHKTVFIMKIGDVLNSGISHDMRAPDYDDWSLNGDIMFWNETLNCAFEISSMGIRVDAKTMDSQLKKSGCDDRRDLPFHKMVLDDTLPLTMGGGIGQSRLCMLILNKVHIGEVQSSIWDKDTIENCEKAGIILL